jgi:hypothetical protein
MVKHNSESDIKYYTMQFYDFVVGLLQYTGLVDTRGSEGMLTNKCSATQSNGGLNLKSRFLEIFLINWAHKTKNLISTHK